LPINDELKITMVKTYSLKNIASKLTLILCTAMLAVSFNSCDKDESMPTPESLIDTTWEAEAQYKATTTAPEQQVLMTLEFTSATAVKYTLTSVSNSAEALVFNGTYEYTKPLLTMTLVVVSSGTQQVTTNISGAADGRKMTIKLEDGQTFVLTRK
jgi:hypothetical protein